MMYDGSVIKTVSFIRLGVDTTSAVSDSRLSFKQLITLDFIHLLTTSIYLVLKVHWFHCIFSVYIFSVKGHKNESCLVFMVRIKS